MNSLRTALVFAFLFNCCLSCSFLSSENSCLMSDEGQLVITSDTNANSLNTFSVQPSSVAVKLKGVAFGTSLTFRAKTTGGYLTKLAELSGITFDNQGIGSSTILGDGDSLDILSSIKKYSSYHEKKVILLEGFVNDWYQGKQLGYYTDKTEDTVCGCVYTAINYIHAHNDGATLFVILDHFGRRYKAGEQYVDCGSAALNRNNQTQYQYYEQISKVAEYFGGVVVIKGYDAFNINEDTPQFYLDNIHLNQEGADKSAEAIYSIMKDYLL